MSVTLKQGGGASWILTLVSTGPWRMGEGRGLWGFRSDTLLHLESLHWVSQGQEQHSLAFFPTGLGKVSGPRAIMVFLL